MVILYHRFMGQKNEINISTLKEAAERPYIPYKEAVRTAIRCISFLKLILLAEFGE